MGTYAISDLHLGHDNMIQPDYEDRPFEDGDSMDKALVRNWNSTIDEDDIVYFLGDLAMTYDEEEYYAAGEQLNGRIIMTVGNHDDGVPETPPFPVVESFVVQERKFRCYCTHRPENVPDEWSEWVVHGHTHSSTPFIDTRKNRVNVSVELLDYTPIEFDYLFDLVDAVLRSSRERVTTLSEAEELFDGE